MILAAVAAIAAADPIAGLIVAEERRAIVAEHQATQRARPAHPHGLTPKQLALLDVIAEPESGGRYDVRYKPGGGAKIDRLDRHPAKCERVTERHLGGFGKCSTAAGRYQVTHTTWKEAVRDLRKDGIEIAGFSPAEQDAVAWRVAVTAYARKTQRNLNEDLGSKTAPAVLATLTGTWEGLRKVDNGAEAYENAKRVRLLEAAERRKARRLHDDRVPDEACRWQMLGKMRVCVVEGSVNDAG